MDRINCVLYPCLVDMLPKSRGKQVKRDIRKERGLKAEKKRRKNKKKKRGTKRDNWPEVIGGTVMFVEENCQTLTYIFVCTMNIISRS